MHTFRDGGETETRRQMFINRSQQFDGTKSHDASGHKSTYTAALSFSYICYHNRMQAFLDLMITIEELK